MQHRVTYIGKAEYCYSNSAAMLLSSIGEDIKPEQIEVSTGIGLGAFLQKNKNLLFFSPLAIAPDVALTKSLQILGFELEEKSFNQEDPPIEDLRKVLETSPVLIGPLDMGFLPYQPNREVLYGVDHFVLIYAVDKEKAYLHDPFGYPHTYLTFEQLKPVWKADNISYKLGPYHWWHSPKRVKHPTKQEIYGQTIEFFRFIYSESDNTAKREGRIINKDAILLVADKIENNELKENEIRILTDFSLPISAKRASDYADFLKPFNVKLAELKYKLSVIFGHTHVSLAEKELNEAASNLKQIAKLEEEFKLNLLSK